MVPLSSLTYFFPSLTAGRMQGTLVVIVIADSGGSEGTLGVQWSRVPQMDQWQHCRGGAGDFWETPGRACRSPTC